MNKMNRTGQMVYSDAIFSPCGNYRYRLTRIWDEGYPMAMCIGLNPSTADATSNDPTIRRTIDFVRSWGFGGMHMLNLFAARQTYPNDLFRMKDPVGTDNNAWLQVSLSETTCVIGMWGNHGLAFDRAAQVRHFLGEIWCLGITKKGQPLHPLYVRKGSPLVNLG